MKPQEKLFLSRHIAMWRDGVEKVLEYLADYLPATVMCSQRYIVMWIQKPEWTQLQLDLFLIFIWTYFIICTVCSVYPVYIVYESSDPTGITW